MTRALGRLGCAAGVAVAGGGGDGDGVWLVVSAVVGDGGGPAGHFADVVAAGAQPAAVGQGGGSAVGAAMDVVEVADGCVAVGVAAGAVPQPDQGAEGAVEAAAEPIGSDDWSVGGGGEQP